MARQIIKLTESDLHNIIKESVNKILKENLYDYTDGQINDFNAEKEFRDSHDWSMDDEEFNDFYIDPDNYRDDVIGWGSDMSDGDLYRGTI